MKKRYNYLYFLLLLLMVGIVNGQAPINSPLTYIGLGEIQPTGLHNQRYRGFTSTADYGPYTTNVRNPAALGRLRAASFDIGLSVRSISFRINEKESSGWYGRFDYLLLSFPIFNPVNDILNHEEREFKWGMMLGIKPYSNIGYNIKNTIELSDGSEVLKFYKGSGGTYKLMWGNGFTYKQFSMGFRLEYILGKMNFNVKSLLAERAFSFVTIQDRSLFLKAFNYDLGAQYNIILDREVPVAEGLKGEPRQYINLGISASTAIETNLTQDVLNVNRSTDFNYIDTISRASNLKGSGVLPGHFEAGIMYRHNESFAILADYKYQAWSRYVNSFQASSIYNLDDTYRVGLGIEYIPDPGALNGYLNRVIYYAGAHYGTDPRVINGEQLSDFGIGAGLTLPLIGRRRRAYMSVSFFYRRKATSDIAENYYGIGLNFKGTDNRWFVQPKFD